MNILKLKLSRKILCKYSIMFLALFVVFLLLFHFIFYGIGSLNLLFVIFIVLLVLLIVGVKRAIQKKKYNTIIISVSIIPIVVLSLLISNKLMNYESKLTETKAKIIVNALNKYYINNREYPKDIKQLIPNYLEQIPQTNMLQGNKKFEYYKTDDGGYILQYYYGYLLKEIYNDDDSWHLSPRG